MINPLKNYRILIVDADAELAKVLRQMLNEMGFSNIEVTRSGKTAITLLSSSKFDFVITEWNTQQMDGLAMLKFIRRDPESPCPTIPIIMLTGRAEQVDVTQARDYGINEYVVKPFTAKAIYSRLERLIEQPRNFVMSETFIGPDRRYRSTPPEGMAERRAVRPPRPQSADMQKEIRNAETLPRIWLPDFSLKIKLGKGARLQDIITPDILNGAQSAIDSITSASLGWIRDNLREMKLLHESMVGDDCPATIVSDIGEVALTVNARAGTFGYKRAAEIAYTLYLFTRNKLDPKNKGHHLVILKHIEVLQVILGHQMSGDAGAVGAQVAGELKSLIAKYS